MFCNLVNLNRYLDNICKNPDEEKFQKVKQSNKVFQVRFSLKKEKEKRNKTTCCSDKISKLKWL